MPATPTGFLFARGNVGVDATSDWAAVWNLREGETLPFDWDWIVLPAGPVGFRNSGGTDAFVIAKASPHITEAYEWISFRTSKEVWDRLYLEKGMAIGQNYSPVRRSIVLSPLYQEQIDPLDWRMLLDMFTYVIPDQFVPRVPVYTEVRNQVFADMMDQILSGQTSVQVAAIQAAERINALLTGIE